MKFLEALNKQTIFFDGAMGTQLMEQGLQLGDIPETWNILHPEKILRVHENYLAAGAHVIQANTFGVNRYKLEGTPYTVADLVSAAFDLTDQALKDVPTDLGRGFAALDIGSIGKLFKPLGDLTFEEAYETFSEIVLSGKDRADLILIETMSDPYEMKAAALAARQNSDLPVVVTMTVGEDGRLFSGGKPECAVAMLEGLQVDVVGLNCSLGPEEMLRIMPEFLACCSLPVLVSPNAGLPTIVDGRAVYGIGPHRFALLQNKMLELGVQALGGCCGTTPSHIREMVRICSLTPRLPVTEKNLTLVASSSRVVALRKAPKIIGERLNPTGKKKLKTALKEKNFSYLQQEALKQEKQGADILDVNVGLPGIDEAWTMKTAVQRIQQVTSLPLQIDTSSPEAMETALRIYNGKPLINSVSGKKETMDQIFPLVKKYGGVVIGLTLDENGIPDTAQGRVEIAKKIIQEAEKYGILKKDILIDTLTLTISTGQEQAAITLEALSRVRDELGAGTVLGVSNVSFGLPNREWINSSFFTLALEHGLSAGIINPGSELMRRAYDLFCALKGYDPKLTNYIERYSEEIKSDTPLSAVKSTSQKSDLAAGLGAIGEMILLGVEESAAKETEKALKEREALQIIDEELIPALSRAGEAFEKGTFFLPQLLMSAAAAQAAFKVIREQMKSGETRVRGRVILATVQGDIHDIGKNIVKVLLENYGFEVLDLGKDVPPETVLETARRENIRLVGLSALMTTTIANMRTTVELLQRELPDVKVMVGGAALTEEYARQMNADFYSKDAMGAVHYAEQIFAEKA